MQIIYLKIVKYIHCVAGIRQTAQFS